MKKTFTTLTLAVLGAVLLAACGSDFASPFDKPDASVQPVDCAASASCG